MNAVFIVLIIIAGAVPHVLDIHSTIESQRRETVFESNSRFRLPNGKANIPKLLLWKLGFYGIAVVLSLALYAAGAGYIAFLCIFVSALITIPTVIKNYRLAGKRSL